MSKYRIDWGIVAIWFVGLAPWLVVVWLLLR